MNGKLQEINAAIGLRQLVGFDRRLKSAATSSTDYRAEFTDSVCGFSPTPTLRPVLRERVL